MIERAIGKVTETKPKGGAHENDEANRKLAPMGTKIAADFFDHGIPW